MPIIIQKAAHDWLYFIKIFKNKPITIPGTEQDIEIAYDDQIYLQNGYYIAGIIRKYLQPFSQEYNELLKIRKIAGLKSPENWAILQPILINLGYQELDQLEDDPETKEKLISESSLTFIIQFLFQLFAEKESLELPRKKKTQIKYIDINNFRKDKPLEQAVNSLQFMCLLLSQSFGIQLGQTLGLLVGESKFLKLLLCQGSRKNEFEGVSLFYDILLQKWPYIEQFLCHNSDKEIQFLLEGISAGLFSINNQIILKTLALLKRVKNQKWFQNTGNLKLLQSFSIQSFDFLIQKQKSKLKDIFNDQLHIKIIDKYKLIKILLSLIRKLPHCLYSKQILNHLPLIYMYTRCFQILNPEDIGSYPPKLINITKQLLTKLICSFPDKIPHNQIPAILEIYQFYENRLYAEQSQMIAMLFQIIQSLLYCQSRDADKFFKLIMKYLQHTHGEIKHWIVDNLRNLYEKMTKQFPIGCFLLMYSMNPIAQVTQYQLFQSICKLEGGQGNYNSMNQLQAKYLLSILQQYYNQQIHCKCFINLIRLFTQKNPKICNVWAHEAYRKILLRFQKISLPLTDEIVSILNPPLPNKNRVVNSIGLKRKQMLKYREYELGENLLKLLTQLNNKTFLQQYYASIQSTVNRLSKQIGVKKTKLITLYKKLAKQIKNNSNKIYQTPKMHELVTSLRVHNKEGDISRIYPVESIKEDAQSKYINDSISSYNESQNLDEIVRLHKNDQLLRKTQQLSINQQLNDGTNSLLMIQEQQNQFLVESPFTDRISKLQNPSENCLLPFTDPQINYLPAFLHQDCLQQYEISYIELMKDKYSHTLQQCSQIYMIISEQNQEPMVIIQKFIKALGLSQIIDLQQAEQLYLQVKIYSLQHKIVQELLIQIGLKIFGFLYNKRIPVTSLKSFFTMLEDRLSRNNISSQKQRYKSTKKQKLLCKQIQFEHTISSKIIPTSNQSYFICFNILNDLMNSCLNLNLAEPTSKIINKINIKEKLVDSQLKDLQQLLIQQNQLNIIQEQNNQKKQGLNSLQQSKKSGTSKFRKKQPIVFIDMTKQSNPRNSKTVNNLALKNKLQERRKLLSKELMIKVPDSIFLKQKNETNNFEDDIVREDPKENVIE